MFVKIKFEPGSGKPNFFSLEDNATIHDLKIKMESIIDIPADCQEIHTLSTSLENGVVLSSMVQPNDTISKTPVMNDSGIGINGAAISLYSNNKFICFLQFYNEVEGNIQGNFFDQVEGDNGRKLPPIDQVPQYTETLDTDSCPSTCSSSSSTSDSSDSLDGSTSDESSSGILIKRKRKLDDDSTTSKRICNASSENPMPQNQASSVKVVECPKKTLENCSKPNESKSNESSPLSLTFSPSLASSPLPLPLPPTPPYVWVDPEHRHLMLVITTDLPEKDFSGLLNYFYTLFETSLNCNRFQFNEKHSVAKFDDKLWLTCANEDTYEWVTRSLSSLSSYKSTSFLEHFNSIKCSIILPKVAKNKPLASVFQLLELQNSGLQTGKWCVLQRKTLLTTSKDYKEKAITYICDNEEVILRIDQNSIDFLKTKECKLKYCFWTINCPLFST
ncbi:uncharacterized protein [Drosophila tropicalis]|uniref:uncharacterized protein n=1 Tax=Drosophila tropicalis TaxID=46794 RepID=UPI0035ABDAC1